MSIEAMLKFLDEDSEVIESYVLVREVKVFLDVGHAHFHPSVRVKVYRSDAMPSQPYHFEVSHYVHTPEQAGPYLTSRTSAASETEAVRQAISTTTSFLKIAIRNGREPSDSWLVPNKDF